MPFTQFNDSGPGGAAERKVHCCVGTPRLRRLDPGLAFGLLRPTLAAVVGVGRLSTTLALVCIGARADITLVAPGQPPAVVVVPDRPTAVVKYAAEELVEHVRRASGVSLRITPESSVPTDPRCAIELGPTRAALAAGIEIERLPAEGSVIRTRGNRLFLAGRDGGGDPLERDTAAGTMFAVYEWLEQDLGVRWLWPGELGTHVPRASVIRAREGDRKVQPRFFQRHVRSGLGFKLEHPALGFTPKAAEAYAREQNVFVRRHRLGRSERFSYGHAFTDWWARYGQAHPEWFQLVKGQRGPAKPGARFSMCVSNPSLQAEIVRLWKEKGGPAQRFPTINLVENDIVGLCECEACRAWDGPPPPDVMKFYSPSSKVYGTAFVSDRYARFALAVQQLAARENPDVKVIGYVYFNYFQAPTSGVRLNENVLLGYCPSGGWYPRAEDEHAWYQRQWRGWREAGARLFFRVNYFLDGYAMPYVFAHQFADDFRHAASHGMAATDFDSLTGQWAVQGPNLYLLMRLHTRPEATTDSLLQEYYDAFGAAGPAVRAYFAHWENYLTSERPRLMAAFEDRVASRWRSFAKVAHRVFPADCFPPAEALLARAAVAAGSDPVASARVEFLRLGLAHAKLCARVSEVLTLADPAATPERGQKVLEELLRFRRAHERSGISNFNHSAWVEEASWKLSTQTRQEADVYP
ncbi:MAG: DUF4838 domain-containing protein [Verrucomicrobia bacterium]|nr:DUF4838 domain-containing protein [Verrucomicrobiota bacterium]